MAKCATIERGDVTVDGIDEPVFRRVYESHQRGVAMFYNNRKGGRATVYPEQRKMFVDGVERRFNKDATLHKALVAALSVDTTDDE